MPKACHQLGAYEKPPISTALSYQFFLPHFLSISLSDVCLDKENSFLPEILLNSAASSLFVISIIVLQVSKRPRLQVRGTITKSWLLNITILPFLLPPKHVDLAIQQEQWKYPRPLQQSDISQFSASLMSRDDT